jgi:hypothetical protein
METVDIRVPAWNIRTFLFPVGHPVALFQMDVLLLLMQFLNRQVFQKIMFHFKQL